MTVLPGLWLRELLQPPGLTGHELFNYFERQYKSFLHARFLAKPNPGSSLMDMNKGDQPFTLEAADAVRVWQQPRMIRLQVGCTTKAGKFGNFKKTEDLAYKTGS